jgi:hypothetical protein
VAVAPRVGISGDIIARQLRDTWHFEGDPATFASRTAGASPSAVSVASDLRALDPGNLTQILAGIGMRAHISRPLLLSIDVLLPVSGDGLMPQVGVVAGFSLAF